LYIENPKTKGSGIICCIPHNSECPVGCEDCFFQSGRSYLEPLKDNLPNMPTIEQVGHRVVRVNDGNDSCHQQDMVIEATKQYPLKFYNTSMNKNLDKFDAPIVVTINPGKKTDTSWTKLDPIPKNLMFVRFRINTWNTWLARKAIEYYTKREVPVVLTFMAYHNEKSIRDGYKDDYVERKRTLNTYYAITKSAWHRIMNNLAFDEKLIYSCGKIEGESNGGCKACGNCLREFFRVID
jgi:hypothetical protein